MKTLKAIREKKDTKLQKKLLKIKGVSQDVALQLSLMPGPTLQALINQLSMIGAETEKEDVEEAALVMSDLAILDSIMNKIKKDITNDKLKGKFEKSWPKMQALAKMAGYNITKKMQAKGRTYRWDLKK